MPAQILKKGQKMKIQEILSALCLLAEMKKQEKFFKFISKFYC